MKKARREMRDSLRESIAVRSLDHLLPIDPADAAADTLTRSYAMLRQTMEEVDSLYSGTPEFGSFEGKWLVSVDAQGNHVLNLHPAVVLEGQLRREVFDIASKTQVVGLASRRVRVAEAQMVLMGRALADAANKAGLSDEQKQLLASGLKESLMELQESPAAVLGDE